MEFTGHPRQASRRAQGGSSVPNNFREDTPNLAKNEFEVYYNCSPSVVMDRFHGHSFYELRIIIHGHILHYNESSISELCSGDISIIPPGLFHRIMPAQDTGTIPDYTRILLYLSINFVRSLDTETLQVSEMLNHFGYSGPQHLRLPDEEFAAFCQLLKDVVNADNDDEPLGHFANRARVMLALSQIARAISQNAFLPPSGENTALIPRVIAYINAHLSSDLSLDMLSERFYISKFYLSHQFKQYTQLSLHQYILSRRMMHAQILLRSGHAPTHVAAACGYREYSSFYKAFLRETGVAPKDFV